MGTRFEEHGHRITMTCPGILFRAIISMAQLSARGLPPDRRFHSPSRIDFKGKIQGPRYLRPCTLYTSGSKTAFGFAVPSPCYFSPNFPRAPSQLQLWDRSGAIGVEAWNPLISPEKTPFTSAIRKALAGHSRSGAPILNAAPLERVTGLGVIGDK